MSLAKCNNKKWINGEQMKLQSPEFLSGKALLTCFFSIISPTNYLSPIWLLYSKYLAVPSLTY